MTSAYELPSIYFYQQVITTIFMFRGKVLMENTLHNLFLLHFIRTLHYEYISDILYSIIIPLIFLLTTVLSTIMLFLLILNVNIKILNLLKTVEFDS